MRLGTAALVLTVGLAFVGLASADESGNWFTRVFTPAEKTDASKKVTAKSEPTPTPPPSVDHRALKAKADLERRRDVCDKLRGIGIATGDDELVRKAELLDQRSWDLYVACVNRARAAGPVVAQAAARKGDGK